MNMLICVFECTCTFVIGTNASRISAIGCHNTTTMKIIFLKFVILWSTVRRIENIKITSKIYGCMNKFEGHFKIKCVTNNCGLRPPVAVSTDKQTKRLDDGD